VYVYIDQEVSPRFEPEGVCVAGVCVVSELNESLSKCMQRLRRLLLRMYTRLFSEYMQVSFENVWGSFVCVGCQRLLQRHLLWGGYDK